MGVKGRSLCGAGAVRVGWPSLTRRYRCERPFTVTVHSDTSSLLQDVTDVVITARWLLRAEPLVTSDDRIQPSPRQIDSHRLCGCLCIVRCGDSLAKVAAALDNYAKIFIAGTVASDTVASDMSVAAEPVMRLVRVIKSSLIWCSPHLNGSHQCQE